MSFFATPTAASEPTTKNVVAVSLLAAGIITIMAVAQLFTFEDFPAVIAALWLPGGESMAILVAAFLVVIEVLSLPFLLSMRLSSLFRYMSMVLGWIVALFWLSLSITENIKMTAIDNSGILGATIPLPVGWWNVLFSLALGVLLVWSSWGMWPGRSKNKKRVV